MKLPIHRWFRYSAGFSATWVEGVIAELEPKIVLDPFAGSLDRKLDYGTVTITQVWSATRQTS
ncbi:MAG: hypothetical protein V7K92_08590 [Nostoc sp.]